MDNSRGPNNFIIIINAIEALKELIYLPVNNDENTYNGTNNNTRILKRNRNNNTTPNARRNAFFRKRSGKNLAPDVPSLQAQKILRTNN